MSTIESTAPAQDDLVSAAADEATTGQPELDRLNGYTFSWLHPFGPHAINFSYDYRKDFSQSASGADFATALRPRIGTVGATLFALGIMAFAYSGLLAVFLPGPSKALR